MSKSRRFQIIIVGPYGKRLDDGYRITDVSAKAALNEYARRHSIQLDEITEQGSQAYALRQNGGYIRAEEAQ